MNPGILPAALPAARDLPPDIQRLLKITRRLPALEKLPVPLARAVYAGAAMLCNPSGRRFAKMKVLDSKLYRFDPRGSQAGADVYFFIHGGGWTLGSPRSYRSYCSWLAERTRSTVFAVDYRLAPEYPYPAALDDCVRAFIDVRKKLGSGRIRVVGDSAGAQLSLSLCQRLRDQGDELPVALYLHYPVLAKPGLTESYQTFAEGLFLSSSMMHWFWSHYRPEGSLLDWPEYQWLPPVSLALARHDVLVDEGFQLARKLDKSGVLKSLHIEENLPHAYINLMKCPSVMIAMERQMQCDAELLNT